MRRAIHILFKASVSLRYRLFCIGDVALHRVHLRNAAGRTGVDHIDTRRAKLVGAVRKPTADLYFLRYVVERAVALHKEVSSQPAAKREQHQNPSQDDGEQRDKPNVMPEAERPGITGCCFIHGHDFPLGKMQYRVLPLGHRQNSVNAYP